MEILGIKPETWFPVVMLILGALLKAISDKLMEGSRAAREREARVELREDTRTAAAVAFQRATLLELQEAVQALARATGRMNHEDVVAYRENGVWRKAQLSPEANDAVLQSNIKMTRLRVRVDDTDVRALAAEFSASCGSVVSARGEAESDSRLMQSIKIFERLNERIGELVRAKY